MSVMVVRIGPEATAGSTFRDLRMTGTVPPIETASTVLIAIDNRATHAGLVRL